MRNSATTQTLNNQTDSEARYWKAFASLVAVTVVIVFLLGIPN